MKFRGSIVYLQWRGRKRLQQHLDFRSLQKITNYWVVLREWGHLACIVYLLKPKPNPTLWVFFFLRMRCNYKSKNWTTASVTENLRVSSLSNTSTLSLKPCDVDCKGTTVRNGKLEANNPVCWELYSYNTSERTKVTGIITQLSSQ